MIGQVVAHYRIIDFLGAGTSGSVYSAEDLKRHRLVALRILASSPGLSQDWQARRDSELEAAASLDHPGIPRIYEKGVSDSFRFVAMQLLDGETLESRMRKGPLPLDGAVETAREVCEALGEAHRRGLVHRNLKPSSIQLSRGVKVSGFGMTPPPSEADLKEVATANVRRPYLSPEQAVGKPPDARSDVFSLGVILYEMITGRRPFSGEGPAEMRRALLNDDLEPPSMIRAGVPGSLDRVVLKALARSPGDRYQTADECAAELAEAARDLNALSMTRAPLIKRQRRHFGTFIPTAATILFLIIVWLLWQAFRRQV